MQEYSGLAKLSADLQCFLLGLIGNADVVALIMILVKIAGIFAVVLTSAIVLVYMERKVCGFMQDRIGPNRVGPRGMLQSVADMLKLLGKEDIIPNGVVFADLNIGIFFIIAIASQSILPFLMGGLASNNKYSLIGSMRTVAQMLSYEIPMVFSLLGIVMLTGSLKMSDIVAAQSDLWFIVLQPFAFIIFVIASTAETNRTPFDLVEGESEIIAGPFTEYSGMRWALFFLAEYANLLAASIITTTLFLGGWHGPFLPGMIWFWLKVFAMVFLFMWFRWTFPRLRVDQLLAFGWKILLPVALINVLVTGVGIYLFKM